jgi:hypothetical protein
MGDLQMKGINVRNFRLHEASRKGKLRQQNASRTGRSQASGDF